MLFDAHQMATKRNEDQITENMIHKNLYGDFMSHKIAEV